MSEPFWDFSVRTYRTDSVPEACLSLQDECGVDVNMLLYCGWFGVTRGRLQADMFRSVLDFSESWSQRVVQPLRHVRTWMKLDGCRDPRVPAATCMEFREKVKGIEFTAEKMQQDVLETLTAPVPEKELALADQLAAMVNNISLYFNMVNITTDNFVRERLLTIVQAEVPEFSTGDIQLVLSSEL